MADVLVLCYHAVSDTWPSELAVTPQALRRQLRSLLSRGYRGATFLEAVRRPAAGRILAVTFDDGYRSVHDVALPILRELGLPGSLYVPTAFVDRDAPMSWPGIDGWVGGPHEHELQCADRAQLEQLADEGWEIGAHTRTHPHLTKLDDAALDDELAGARADLERLLGRPCTSIAYPYGDVDARVIRAAAAAGYEAGATLPERQHRADALAWPRIGVYPGDVPWRFRLKSAPLVRKLRR